MYIMVDWNIFVQNNICNCVEKMQYIAKFLKQLKTFMKKIIFISHVIAHTLNHVCELCEKFDYFHFTNGIFPNLNHKYVINWKFNK
jgi:hypothetical protein